MAQIGFSTLEWKLMSLGEKERFIDDKVIENRNKYGHPYELKTLTVRYIFTTEPTLSEEEINKIDKIILGKPIWYEVYPLQNRFIAENMTSGEINEILTKISKIKRVAYYSVTTADDYLIAGEGNLEDPIKRTLEMGKNELS